MRLRIGQRDWLWDDLVERTSLHFCSDVAAARVANARMQPSGASHRLNEAYCQRPAGRSWLAAHAAFHDVFSRGEPSARCGRSGRAVGASRRAVRSWDAPRRLSCPAEACSRWPLARCGAEFPACIMHACTPEAVLGGHGRGWLTDSPVVVRPSITSLQFPPDSPKAMFLSKYGRNGALRRGNEKKIK